jgi:uncharacterized iron-regulated membrane protein
MRSGAARRLVRQIHLWIGLSLGALLLLAGLTGSALVFYVEIDRWLHPEISAPAASAPPDFDLALQTLRQAFPDKQGPWRFEVVGDGGAIPARYYNPPERADRAFAPMMVWLSPDGSSVLRRDYWGDYLMTWLYDLHYRLLLGTSGALIMGYAGLASLFLLMTGVWAWWPRKGRLRSGLRLKLRANPVRSLYDWHKLAGLIGAIPLLVVFATGAMLSLPGETRTVLEATLGPVSDVEPPLVQPQASSITIKSAIAAAAERLPDARLAWIETPGTSKNVYTLRLQAPEDPSRRFPHSYAYVSATDASVLTVDDIRKHPPANVVLNWLHPLHEGSFGGIALRVIYFVVGLIPVALFLTGLARWLIRRKRSSYAAFNANEARGGQTPKG